MFIVSESVTVGIWMCVCVCISCVPISMCNSAMTTSHEDRSCKCKIILQFHPVSQIGVEHVTENYIRSNV